MISRVMIRKMKTSLAQFVSGILISNVPFEAEQELIFDMILSFGPISGFEFRRQFVEGEWFAFGFVLFQTEDAAERALLARPVVLGKVLNLNKMGKLGLGEAHLFEKHKSLFRDRYLQIADKVVELPLKITPDSNVLVSQHMLDNVESDPSLELEEYFGKFGKVKIRIQEKGESKKVAFFEFEEPKCALLAKLFWTGENYRGNEIDLHFEPVSYSK